MAICVGLLETFCCLSRQMLICLGWLQEFVYGATVAPINNNNNNNNNNNHNNNNNNNNNNN